MNLGWQPISPQLANPNYSQSAANALFTTTNAAFPTLGGPDPSAFDFGLPFFYGRDVFIGLNFATATSSSGTVFSGPFYAY